MSPSLVSNVPVVGAVFALALAVGDAVVEPDLVRYALTQGGLFGMCLVLVYMVHKQNEAKEELLKAQIKEKDERLAALVQLVGETKTALAQLTAAINSLNVQGNMSRHRVN